jgi:hypothetical protein
MPNQIEKTRREPNRQCGGQTPQGKCDGDRIGGGANPRGIAREPNFKSRIHPTHLHANDRLPTRVCTQSSWTVINVTVVPYESVRLAP